MRHNAAMADVVYLHVGAPKTGTTYLQGRLHHNRDALASRGVHYPAGLRRDMFVGALDLIDRHWGGQREEVRGEWDALAARVRRVSGTAIVSHEILASATVEQVDRALAGFGAAEVHVVYSARDLGRQIPAEWQESIKHRSRRRFRAYVKLIRTRDQVDSDLWFWRVHSLPDVLRRWTRDVPPGRVHLITVPPSGAEPEVLWRRFCQACGIDPSIGEPVGGRANASLGIEEIAVLRDLNKRLRRSGLDSASYGRLVREGIAQGVLAQRADMRKAVLGPRHRDWASQTAEGWIAWVQEAGIDVVGDLDDLRPVFPPVTEKWRNPDRPRARVTRDAAMTALTGAVLEAASRPDPDAAPIARLGRAARRLRGR